MLYRIRRQDKVITVMEKNWKVVFTGKDLYMAESVKHMLETNGIEAVVLNKIDSAYPSIGFVEVLVGEDDHSAAETLITESES